MKTLSKQLKAKREKNETIVVPYIMAGAQGLDNLEKEIKLLEKAGAATIELGIPFSDPVADGPVIQKAGLKALEQKVSLTAILDCLKTIQTSIPLVIMTYFNPVYVFGVEKFFEELKQTPVKGLIVPDLPYEHREYLETFLEKSDISLIPLISLTTPKERIVELVKQGEGFIYAVAVNGVTGVDKEYQNTLDQHLNFVQENSELPVLAGFGVSDVSHVQRFRESCSGVIVGSKIVKLLDEGKTEEVAEFVAEAAKV